jgi:acid stress-induced BolA-like protein IbaG/YrbA
MNPDQIAELIRTGLPGAEVQIESDDNTHFSGLIVSDAFAGKRTLQRHQLVYAALGELMGREIHALTMQTHTPAEWQAAQQNNQQ